MHCLLHPVTVSSWNTLRILILATFIVRVTLLWGLCLRPRLCTQSCTVVSPLRMCCIGVILFVANRPVRHLTGTCRVLTVLNRPLVLLVLRFALWMVLMTGDSGGTH